MLGSILMSILDRNRFIHGLLSNSVTLIPRMFLMLFVKYCRDNTIGSYPDVGAEQVFQQINYLRGGGHFASNRVSIMYETGGAKFFGASRQNFPTLTKSRSATNQIYIIDCVSAYI